MTTAGSTLAQWERSLCFELGARGPQTAAYFCPSLLLVWTFLLVKRVSKTAIGKWRLLASAKSRKAKLNLQSSAQSLPGADSIQFTTRTLVRSPQPSQRKKCSLLQILASNSCFLPISDPQLLCDSIDTAACLTAPFFFLLPGNNLFLPLLLPCVPPQPLFPIPSLLTQLLSNSYLQQGQYTKDCIAGHEVNTPNLLYTSLKATCASPLACWKHIYFQPVLFC